MEVRLLPHYPRAVTEGVVISAGLHIREVVGNQIRANRSQKRKLTTAFWSDVIGQFGLTAGSCVGELEDPNPDERISELLLEKLGQAS